MALAPRRPGLPLIVALLVAGGLIGVSWWVHWRPVAQGMVPSVALPPAIGPHAPIPQRTPASNAPSGRVPSGLMPSPAQARASFAQRKAMQEELGRQATVARNAAAAMYLRETIDPHWGPSKQAELEDIASAPAFATGGATPDALAVACRRTLCKLDASFATSAQADDWSMLFTASVGNAMPSSTVTRLPATDGSTHLEIYGKAR